MGSTSVHREKGTSNREWFEQEWPESLAKNGRILECATVKGVFYAAVQNNENASYKPGATWALVVLTWWNPRADYFNFTYKDMDETMGPAYYDAPAKVLDLLSPTDSEYALQWRAACRDTIERKAKASKVKPGETIVFTRTFRFGDEVEESRFTLVKRDTLRRISDGQLVRIPGWRGGAWEKEGT